MLFITLGDTWRCLETEIQLNVTNKEGFDPFAGCVLFPISVIMVKCNINVT